MKKLALAFIISLIMLFIATSVADWPMLGYNEERTSYGSPKLAIEGAVQVQYANNNLSNLAWTPLITKNGTDLLVIAGTNSKTVYVLKNNSIFSFNLTNQINGQPMVYGEYALFPVVNGLQYFNITSNSTGNIPWINSNVSSIGVCNNSLLVISNKTLYLANMSLANVSETPLNFSTDVPIASKNGIAFIANNTYVLAVNCTELDGNLTNATLWKTDLGDNINWITAGDYLFVAGDDKVHKLNITNGSEVANTTVYANMLGLTGNWLFAEGKGVYAINTTNMQSTKIGDDTGELAVSDRQAGGYVLAVNANQPVLYLLYQNASVYETINVSDYLHITPIGQPVLDNDTEGIVLANNTGIFVLSTAPDFSITGENITKNFTVSWSGANITVNITSVNVSNGEANLSDYYNKARLNITVNGTYFGNTSANISNGEERKVEGNASIARIRSGAWSIPISIETNAPDENATNNHLSIESPIVSEITGNWTENNATFNDTVLINQTVQLNISIASAGSNSTAYLYLFGPDKNETGDWNYTNTSGSWQVVWTSPKLNKTGDWKLVVVVDKENGIPAWWSKTIHVKNKVNLSSLNVSGLVLKYNGKRINMSEPVPTGENLSFYFNITGLEINGTVVFGGDPKFMLNGVTKDTTHKVAKYNFTSANFSKFDGYLYAQNLSMLKIEPGKIQVFHCTSSCSKLGTSEYSYTVSDGYVDTVKIHVTGFSTYLINETASSTSSTSSSSSSSSSSNGESGSGSSVSSSGGGSGSGSSKCDYYAEIQIPDKITLFKGVNNTINFIIKNTGTCSDIFMPEISGIPSNWYTLSPTSLEIEPGKTHTFTLRVSPDETGNFTLKIILDQESVWKSVKLNIVGMVKQKTKKTLTQVEVLPKQIELTGGMTTGTIEVRNTGNQEVDIKVSVIGNVSSVVSIPNSIRVMPNSRETITLNIANKTGLYSGYIQLTYSNKTTKIPITIDNKVRHIEKASVGGSTIWPVVALLVILALGAGAYYFREDIISMVQSSERKPKGGLSAVKPRYKPKKIRRG